MNDSRKMVMKKYILYQLFTYYYLLLTVIYFFMLFISVAKMTKKYLKMNQLRQ